MINEIRRIVIKRVTACSGAGMYDRIIIQLQQEIQICWTLIEETTEIRNKKVNERCSSTVK